MLKNFQSFLKLLVDRVRAIVLWVVRVTVQAGGNVATRLTNQTKRKKKKVMNGKTVAVSVLATVVLLVVIKKAGTKIPAAVRNWLP